MRVSRQRTVETPVHRETRLEAEKRAVETPVHRETRLEAEKSRFRRKDVHAESGENENIIFIINMRHHNNSN